MENVGKMLELLAKFADTYSYDLTDYSDYYDEPRPQRCPFCSHDVDEYMDNFLKHDEYCLYIQAAILIRGVNIEELREKDRQEKALAQQRYDIERFNRERADYERLKQKFEGNN